MVTPEQKEKIKRYAKKIKKSSTFKENLDERKEREERFREALKRENLEKMDEYSFGKIISDLWATSFWKNVDYKINKVIDANGLDNLRKEFINLLYGTDPIEKRLDGALKNIKELGPSSITEILSLFNPKEYGIWNKKARVALEYLGFSDQLPFLKKYTISGKEYVRYNNLLKEIGKILEDTGYKDVDLFVVDFFLWEIWKISKEGGKEEEYYKEWDHNEIRDYIKEIGEMLGFDAEIEKNISTGARVDVIWQAKIANLGVVTYVFEVQKKGSIDSLILNLQKASSNPTVQKIIAVSDAPTIEKIKREVQDLPGSFRNILTYWDVRDVEKAYENLSNAMAIIGELELVKSSFAGGGGQGI